MANNFAFDVFLSHNSADKPRVRRLAEGLRQAGLRVWFDEWTIKPGEDIYLAIERGLEAARTLVLCLSPAALGSNWVGLERSTVLFRDPANADRRFIPVLLTDCDLPDTLRRYKYVDLRRESGDAFEELLTACRLEIPPAVPPSLHIAEVSGQRARKREPQEPSAVLERELTGHGGPVNSICISPDGKWAAFGLNDTVKILDLETWEYRATLREYSGTVSMHSIAITPDGKHVAYAAGDNTVRICDVDQGRTVAVCDGHARAVITIEVAADGNRLISASKDGTIRLWNIHTGMCLGQVQSGFPRNYFALAQDGKWAILDGKEMGL